MSALHFQEHLKILRAAAERTLPSQISIENTDFSFEALRELYEADRVSGTPSFFVEITGSSILNIKITLAGREYLAELERRDAVAAHAAEPAAKEANQSKEWHESFLGKLAVGILIAALAYAATRAFGLWF